MPLWGRALLLVGFFAVPRRSELAALAVEHLTEHPRGLVLELPRSKTNQTGAVAELVILPRASRSERCPVTALTRWLDAAAITAGPMLRKAIKANRPTGRGLHPESVNVLVQNAIARARSATGHTAETRAPATGSDGEPPVDGGSRSGQHRTCSSRQVSRHDDQSLHPLQLAIIAIR
ncbi:MAG: hypothetical protein AB7G09_10625 [Pseudonocardia sp.]|jgi:hypothetical protein